MKFTLTTMIRSILVISLVTLAACSQQSGAAKTCYSDNLPGGDTVVTKMLVKPQFKGGNSSFNSFLSTNISFDRVISKLPEKGEIYNDTASIKFIVSKQGNLCSLSITKARNSDFTDEIERVIKKSSCDWSAGRTKEPVNGWFRFDLYFSVEQSTNGVKTSMTFNEYVPTD